jgi:hypothetical protein
MNPMKSKLTALFLTALLAGSTALHAEDPAPEKKPKAAKQLLNTDPEPNLKDPAFVSLFEEKNEYPKGFIGLQVHGGKQGTILWRNLSVMEL